MLKTLPIIIGLRYTGAKRRNHFISFISAISMAGLTLGVAVLILVLSVMNGFDRELRQRILGMVPHAALYSKDGLENWQELANQVKAKPGIVGVAPFVNIQGMMSHKGRVQGVMVNGIEPEWEKKVSILPDFMKLGEFDSLSAGEYHIILGDLLARKLGVTLGEKVTLIMPEASLTPAGVMPRLKRFTVSGVFSVGAELDANFAYIHMVDAAKMARMKYPAQGLRLKTEDLFQAPRIAWNLTFDLDASITSSDWTRTHGNLFQAIQMEKTMIGLLLLIIVAVAAFNIVSTLVMVVTDKQGDIAILRTLGMSPGSIMQVFMVQGSVIGVVGILLGTSLGIVLALTVTDIIAGIERLLDVQFLNANVYFISYLPSELKWQDVMVVTGSGLLMSFLATLYPAYRASKVKPAEALRYDI
ncbi:lipoprotein-releasing ABC transporter permease subunit [Bermanella sp. WJH001]|uniref:lipoprotein-releasing ABC transporter permease subunit n=1 Tax=Bermanella sp. WJH001 TaxID=3048005 RepID=UPI0024BF0259|nr:lipoprotein-releasing ABC transporter permease subunit [Bermanella sp. WJH001]MDJ1537191.1 lipoprotein-releasing ABC transporter permease subunit [Bermanella sp. WJH001]